MYQDSIITIVYWTAYFAIHSLLASRVTKAFFEENTPFLFARYRIIYNLVSVLGLLFILYYLATTPSQALLKSFPATKYVGLILASWGLIVIKVAFKNYSTREFLGLKISGNPEPLITKGILKYVRHPIYSGTILILLGFVAYIPNLLNLVSVSCVFIYLWIGIKLEEQKLIQLYGDAYREYKSSTPSLIPKIFG